MVTRTERFWIRVSPADKALVQQAAREAGVSASRFVVEAVVRHAEETVSRQNRFVVPAPQWVEFVAALDRAPHDSRARAVAGRGHVGR